MPTEPTSARQRVREAIARIEHLGASAETEDVLKAVMALGWMYQQIKEALVPSPAMTRDSAKQTADDLLRSCEGTIPAEVLASAFLACDAIARLSCAAELEQKNKRIAELHDELCGVASAVDLANCWARESGVEEANVLSGLKGVINRLWGKLSGQLEQKDREIAALKLNLSNTQEILATWKIGAQKAEADSARLRERLRELPNAIFADLCESVSKTGYPESSAIATWFSYHKQRVLRRLRDLISAALSPQPTVESPAADEHGECPNCANPPHDGPCRRKQAPQPPREGE